MFDLFDNLVVMWGVSCCFFFEVFGYVVCDFICGVVFYISEIMWVKEEWYL